MPPVAISNQTKQSIFALAQLLPRLPILGSDPTDVPMTRPSNPKTDKKGKADMTEWSEFALSMSAFLGSHMLPRLGGLREKLIAGMGRRAYFSLYGFLSLVVLGWVLAASAQAPYVELWAQQSWMRWLVNLAMPLVFVLICCGIGVCNPFTLGGRSKAEFDPNDPGFAALSRHPLLLALLIWALVHLIANGDLAHVLLFAIFALFPLGAMWVFDLKAQRVLGAKARPLLSGSAWLSLRPLASPDWLRRNRRTLLRRSGFGLMLWFAVLHLHFTVIGAWPFP